MKYMVMECHSAYAVVLGDDGRFLKVANLHYEVGDTVTDVTELSIPQPKQDAQKMLHRRWLTSLAAMAACLVLVITSLFSANQRPYASVFISINPEVRIDVNRKDMVVGIEGVNEDGITLVSGYRYQGKNLDLVVDELVDLAIDMEYLHEGGKIVLSLDADEEWITSHQEHLTDHLNQHLVSKIPVIIDVETKKHHDTVPPVPTAPVVIPVTSQDYSDSDYGEPQDDDGDHHDDDDSDIEEDRDDDDEDDSPYHKPTPAEPSPPKKDPQSQDSDYASDEDDQNDAEDHDEPDEDGYDDDEDHDEPDDDEDDNDEDDNEEDDNEEDDD